tara:strand:- start:4281 stop:4550 length:270 start_codon:yes stop_codon:yes gene_type:complete
MATVTIRLIVDATSGKKNVVIAYDSDADALPMEHEDDHKRIVNQLLEGGTLSAADLGEVIVERDQPAIAKQDEDEAEPAANVQPLSEDA